MSTVRNCSLVFLGIFLYMCTEMADLSFKSEISRHCHFLLMSVSYKDVEISFASCKRWLIIGPVLYCT